MMEGHDAEPVSQAAPQFRKIFPSDAAVKRAALAFMTEMNRWTIKMVPRLSVRLVAEVECDWCVYRDNGARYRLISRHKTQEAAQASFTVKSTEAAMRAALGTVAHEL